MKRPLLTAMIFLIFGTITGHYAFDAFVLFFVLVCALCAAVFIIYRKPEYVLIFLLVFLVGFFRVQSSTEGHPDLDAHAEARNVIDMYGVVLDTDVTSTGRLKLVVRLLSFDDGIRTTECDIKIQAVVEPDDDVEISRGIKLRGKPEFLDTLRNPGGFDEEMYLKSRGVMYKTFPEILEIGDKVERIKNYTNVVKNKLAYVYDMTLPPREAGTVKSMIIGDRTGLEEDLSELYRDVGIFHILSISGLHVSALGMMLDLLIGRFFGRKASGAVTIVFLVLYTIMTGCAVASVRAAIMMSAVISARLMNRSSDLIVSTAFAALCLLLYSPLYLWDIGFQYSFGAVFGIAFLTAPIERVSDILCGRSKIFMFVFGGKYVKKYLPATLAATVATIPIMLYHYYYFVMYAIIVNMLIIPGSSVLLFFGAAIGVLGMLWLGAAEFLSGVVFVILRVFEVTSAFFASLPFATVLTGKPALWMCAFWYAAVGGAVYLINGGLKSEGLHKPAMTGYVFVILFVPLAAACFYGLRPERLVVDVADVGQGECIVITCEGLTFLSDGGGRGRTDGAGDTGVRIIKPYLDYRGIEKIDGVFVSHFDADHVTGILEILELKQVGKIFVPDIDLVLLNKADEDALRNYEILLSLAGKYKIPIESLGAGDRVVAGGMSFECLNPHADDRYSDINSASMVLRLVYGQTSFLLTGDIDITAEKLMLKRAEDISADVLMLAHHGSKYSNHEDFIDAVNPRAAIASAGRNNVYGHPAEAVREILHGRDIELYNTADGGMIRITSDGHEISIEEPACFR